MKLIRQNANLVCFITALLFLTGPLLAHFRIVPSLAGFGIFMLSVLLGILCIFAGIFAVKAGKIQTGVLLFSIGALPVFITGYSAATTGNFPRINDVSTDIDNPPVLIDQRTPEQPVAMTEEAIEAHKSHYSDLTPLKTKRTPEEAFQVALDEVKSRAGWTIVTTDQENLLIHGYEQFGIFQFTDDFTIRVTPSPEGGALVDMRSKSRYGKGDLGANARRVRGFLATISSKLQ